MSRKKSPFKLPAPYLKRVWLDKSLVTDPAAYPFCLPLFRSDFALVFERPITIIVGENGTGKSTLLEGIAAMAGYDDAGGGKGYMPVDHSTAIEASGGRLAAALRASWLPKITNGWFFKAESFFTVARYLDRAAIEGMAAPPDFLSHSHGEGSCAFSRSAATGRAFSSSTNRNRRCHRRGRLCSCGSCSAWIGWACVRSSSPRTRQF